MFDELYYLLSDFNPTLTKHANKFNIVSDIVVLSQVDFKDEPILFGYVEDLTGKHGWIRVADNEPSMIAIIETVKSQIALRTQA